MEHNLKALTKNEMVFAYGGALPIIVVGTIKVVGWVAGALAAAATVELITEGVDQCMADFQEGYNEVN